MHKTACVCVFLVSTKLCALSERKRMTNKRRKEGNDLQLSISHTNSGTVRYLCVVDYVNYVYDPK